MKISVKIFFITVIPAFFLAGCSNDAIYRDEQYKPVVYLLSGAGNIYGASYTLNEDEPVCYVSIGCGGTNANGKDITVTLEPNPDMLDKYNSLNYDYKEQYAKQVPADKYNIASYSITLPAGSEYHYARMPVKVRPLGLSPDTLYFIPLKIRSVSNYEVNENKQDLLFRVAIENDYARQLVPTYYSKSGVMTNPTGVLSGNVLVQPLTKDKVRMMVGNNAYTGSTTVADIKRLSVVIQINPKDNSLIVTPYDPESMQVEMLHEKEGYNCYNPNLMQGLTKQRVLYLNFSCKYKNTDGSWTGWRNVEERLIRVEEN